MQHQEDLALNRQLLLQLSAVLREFEERWGSARFVFVKIGEGTEECPVAVVQVDVNFGNLLTHSSRGLLPQAQLVTLQLRHGLMLL